MSETFKFGAGNWATKEGAVLAYNDENGNFKPLPFNFTRATSATRVNKDGLIEVVGSNKPRVDYLNNADGHLLLEPSRTNYVLYTETEGIIFGSNGWQGNSDTIITRNYGTTPFSGTELKSTRLQFAGASKEFRNKFTSVTIQATASSWVKGTAGETIKFGSLGNDALFTLNGGWQRLVKSDTISQACDRISFNTFSGATARDIEIYAPQVEAGSYATSYIPTSGSSVTRAAERSDATLNSSVLSNIEGTVFIDVDYKSTGNSVVLASPHDGAANKRIEIWANGSTINGFIGGSVNITIGSTSISNGRHRIALAYRSGDSAFYIDGNQVGVSSTAFTISALTKFSFNQYQGTLVAIENVKDAKIYNTRLSNAELATLTSL